MIEHLTLIVPHAAIDWTLGTHSKEGWVLQCALPSGEHQAALILRREPKAPSVPPTPDMKDRAMWVASAFASRYWNYGKTAEQAAAMAWALETYCPPEVWPYSWDRDETIRDWVEKSKETGVSHKEAMG